MARTVAVIQQQIIDSKNANATLAGLNSPSQTAIWLLWSYITAVAINLFEQLLDIFSAETEAKIAKAGAGTLPWLRDQVLRFQYSATSPQFVELNTETLTIAYPVVDESLRILSRASVTQSANRIISVKIAKSEPPVPLNNTEITALQSYLDEVAYAGTQMIIINKAADSLIVAGKVFYTGQYSSTISSDVITALQNYCQNLSSVENFGSAVKATDIIKVILAVPGVTDFKPEEISVRPDGSLIGSRNKVFELSTGTDNVAFVTVSGYIVEETEIGYTFADTLVFESN